MLTKALYHSSLYISKLDEVCPGASSISIGISEIAPAFAAVEQGCYKAVRNLKSQALKKNHKFERKILHTWAIFFCRPSAEAFSPTLFHVSIDESPSASIFRVIRTQDQCQIWNIGMLINERFQVDVLLGCMVI